MKCKLGFNKNGEIKYKSPEKVFEKAADISKIVERNFNRLNQTIPCIKLDISKVSNWSDANYVYMEDFRKLITTIRCNGYKKYTPVFRIYETCKSCPYYK